MTVVDPAALRLRIWKQLTDVGNDIIVTTYTNTYDPATGDNVRVGTPFTVKATPPYQKLRAFGQDSQAYGQTAMTLSAEGMTIVPHPGDKVTDGTENWTIESTTTHAIKNTVLAYELLLRQGGQA